METMKKKVFVLAAALLASPAVFAGGMEDDPLLFKLMLDQLEWRDADGDDLFVWEADAWIGRDLNKLWFKSEGERAGSVSEGAEIQALYSRAVDPYWDFQIGWRHDLKPEPGLARGGLQGTGALLVRGGRHRLRRRQRPGRRPPAGRV